MSEEKQRILEDLRYVGFKSGRGGFHQSKNTRRKRTRRDAIVDEIDEGMEDYESNKDEGNRRD